MAQQTVTRSIPKYPFKMSDTKIIAWTSSEQGVVVSGTTKFDMNIASNKYTTTATTAGNYVVPDFTQTLTGTLTLDENAPVVELRKVPIEEAKRIIYQYIKEHPASRTTDLIIELTLEPDIVIEALSQLRCEGKVEGKDVSRK
jgi:hypothetical protein